MDSDSGELKIPHEIEGVVHPSFLTIDPKQRYLYAVNETTRHEGEETGGVSAFSIDPQSGGLTFINHQPSHGGAPCHLIVDRTGRWVLLANYSSGSASVFPIQDGGRLGSASDVVQHQGSSADARRQAGPHAHSILLDSSNRFAYVPDLGIDKIMIYRFDAENGKLKPNDPPFAQVKAGSGPRHFTFHPSEPYAFGIMEMSSEIISFAFNRETGSLTEIQTVSTLPQDFEGQNSCADIHVSPDGNFLYGSNRGHDSIVIFRIDKQNGKLHSIGHESTQGKTPRNFAIDPSGTFLFAANQNTDTVVTFRIDPKTGKLKPAGHTIQIPNPVCIQFMKKRSVDSRVGNQ